ncbi:hypothetical protein [Abyssogena phaseoliformis symbiont]|nr:hypothetical protein [Abyssogena phaseoliformis symbiont]MBW5288674.1 hypothetical protein [Candidatus Ruthia sp. Apha_13_S6]
MIISIIYPKTIRIGNNIAVLDLNFKKKDISIKALVFKIVSYQEFLA